MSDGTIIIPNGTLANRHCSPAMGLDPDKLGLKVKRYSIPLKDLTIWDSSTRAVLPASASGDDLALIVGTFGTSTPKVSTEDVKATSSTRYALATFQLPAEYAAGQPVSLIVTAGMETTVSDTSAHVDAVGYLSDDAAGIEGSDLVGTSEQDMNDLTPAEFSFTLSPTNMEAGDYVFVRVAIIIVDGATGTAVIGNIYKVAFDCTVRG